MIRVTNNEQTVELQITSNSTPAVISALNNDSRYYAEKASSAVAETTQNVSVCEAMATIAKDSATQTEGILATVQSHSVTAIEKANIAVEASNQATNASLSAQASAVSAENSLEAAINAANNALTSELRAKEYIEDIDKLEETVETVEAIAFEMNEIADTLATIDLSNISASGKSLASKLGAPSSRYIDLQLGASGTIYTAPANGWVCIRTITPDDYGFVSLALAEPYSMENLGRGKANECAATTLKVSVGAKFIVHYTIAELTYFRFHYAEGEVA